MNRQSIQKKMPSFFLNVCESYSFCATKWLVFMRFLYHRPQCISHRIEWIQITRISHYIMSQSFRIEAARWFFSFKRMKLIIRYWYCGNATSFRLVPFTHKIDRCSPIFMHLRTEYLFVYMKNWRVQMLSAAKIFGCGFWKLKLVYKRYN